MAATSQQIRLAIPSRDEFRWAAGFAAAVMALTCLPYLYGLLIRPEGYYYSGFLTNPDEHNVYLSYIKEAVKGRWLFLDPFTSEPQAGKVLNVVFLKLGLLCRLTHIPIPLMYHLSRVVGGWLLLLSAYCLAAQALQEVRDRRLALWMIAFASGLGWLYHAGPGQPHPIDYGPGLVMPEAITFLSLLLNPLFCLSLFLMVVATGLGAYSLASGSRWSAAIAGLMLLLLGNIHTYDVIPVAVTLTLFVLMLLVQRRFTLRGLSSAVVMIVITSPSLIYQYWLIISGDVTMANKIESAVESPAALYLVMGLGLPLLLSLGGLFRAIHRESNDWARLLTIWLVAGFVLVYLPVPFQRKLAQGLQLPAVILAVAFISPLLNRLGSRRWLTATALILMMIPSNVLYVARGMRDLATNNSLYLSNLMPPLYLRPDQYSAMTWLDKHTDYRDVVLCNSFLGSYVPSLAGCRTYVGHWDETINFPEKVRDYRDFLLGSTNDDFRTNLITDANISYLIRDNSIFDEISLLSQDNNVQPAFQPDKAAWLEEVWREGEVSVYRVRNEVLPEP